MALSELCKASANVPARNPTEHCGDVAAYSTAVGHSSHYVPLPMFTHIYWCLPMFTLVYQ